MNRRNFIDFSLSFGIGSVVVGAIGCGTDTAVDPIPVIQRPSIIEIALINHGVTDPDKLRVNVGAVQRQMDEDFGPLFGTRVVIGTQGIPVNLNSSGKSNHPFDGSSANVNTVFDPYEFSLPLSHEIIELITTGVFGLYTRDEWQTEQEACDYQGFYTIDNQPVSRFKLRGSNNPQEIVFSR